MGSKIGWFVAGAIAIFAIAMVSLYWLNPPHSGPTAATMRTGFMDRQEVDLDLRQIVGYAPDQPGNAADDYYRAVEIYLDEVADGDEVSNAAQERMHEHIAAGAHKQQMNHTLRYWPTELRVRMRYKERYDGQMDPADTLHDIAQQMVVYAQRAQRYGSRERAEQVLQDTFVLGWHMMEERGRPYMVIQGIAIQQQALQALAALYEDWGDARAAQLRALQANAGAWDAIRRSIDAKRSVLDRREPHPGDVFNMAENEQDPAWRMQAILLLGVIKLTTTGGDASYALRLIDRYEASDDPILAAAARAARAYSRDDLKGHATRY